MPKRTRKESILRYRKLWTFGVKYNAHGEEDLYGLAKLDENDMFDCPLCEYDFTHKSKKFCGTDCIIPWEGGHCLNSESSFKKWCLSRVKEEREFYAQRIVDLCDKALHDLNE